MPPTRVALHNDAAPTLKRILLCCPGYNPVLFTAHPRNYHGPIHVRHDINTARFVVEAGQPRATITLNGSAIPNGTESAPIPLSVGRNAFEGRITAPDGKTTIAFHCKVFRAHPHPSWDRVAQTSAWTPRDSAGELVFNDRMWLLGGFIPELTNDVWSSADGVEWSRGGDIPTQCGIDIPMACVFRDRMWVADVDGVLFSSTDGTSWSVATAEAPWRGRVQAGCAVFNDRMWIMGGRRDGQVLNDVWSSSDGVHWDLELAHAPWCGRMIHHTPVVFDDRMWLLGGSAMGADYYPFVAWNDVWSTTDGRQWERILDHAPWVPRIWGSTAVYRDRMWLLAGFRSEPAWENLGDVWYSANGSDWRRLPTVPSIRHSGRTDAAFGLCDGIWAPKHPREMHAAQNSASFALCDSIWTPRHEQSVYAFDDSLWVVGGMIWPLMNDVWRISIPGLCFVSQPVIETYANTQYEYRACADFSQGRRSVRYRLEQGPDWLQLDADTGILRGIPTQTGNVNVCVEASDGKETTSQEFTLHVLAL